MAPPFQDIDGCFGIISKYIATKSLYTVAAFVQAIYAAFLYSPDVTVVPVPAVFEYKDYYDKCIDKHLKVLSSIPLIHTTPHPYPSLPTQVYKEEYTNHGFKIERVAAEEEAEATRLFLPGIKTNYRKYASNATLDLMPIEAMYETTTDDVLSPALQFCPRIIISNWIPSCADEADRDIGTSFLVAIPRHMPSPAEFEVGPAVHKPLYAHPQCTPLTPVFAPLSHPNCISLITKECSEYFDRTNGAFFRMLRKHFNRLDLRAIIDDWKTFFEDHFPRNDDVADFCRESGGTWLPPLFEWMYSPVEGGIGSGFPVPLQERPDYEATPAQEGTAFQGKYASPPSPYVAATDPSFPPRPSGVPRPTCRCAGSRVAALAGLHSTSPPPPPLRLCLPLREPPPAEPLCRRH